MDPTLALSFQPQGTPAIPATPVDGRSTPAIPQAKLSPPPTSPPGEPSALPAPRRDANSFADVTGDFPDLVLAERQRRLRRIVVGVMSGAMGLLFLAGVCGLVRHASESDVVTHANVATTDTDLRMGSPLACHKTVAGM